MNRFLAVVLVTLLAVALSVASYYLIQILHRKPLLDQNEHEAPASSESMESQEIAPLLPVPDRPQDPLSPDMSKNANEFYVTYENGVNALEAGRFEEAIVSLQQVTDRFPDAILGLGFAHFSLGEYDEAKEWLESYIVINDSLLPRKLLSRIAYSGSDLQSALDHARAGLAIKEDPDLRRLEERIAKELVIQKDYIKEVTSHFDFYYDGYEQRDTGRVVTRILEDAYAEIGKDIGYYPRSAIHVIMYTNKAFHEVTDTPAWTGGLFDGKIRVPLKGAGNDLSLLRKILYHEYVHALIFSLTTKCPVWLNEGLAEYFSSGPAPAQSNRLSLDSLNRPFISLPPDLARSAYRSSHGAVTDLIDRFGLYRLKDLLLMLDRYPTFDEAFEAAYPQSFSDFRNQWAEKKR